MPRVHTPGLNDSVSDAARDGDALNVSYENGNDAKEEAGQDEKLNAHGNRTTESRDVAADRKPRVERRLTLLSALLLVGFAVSIVLSGAFYFASKEHSQRSESVTAVIGAAQDGILNLTNLSHTQTEEHIDRLLDHSTGSFARQFSSQREQMAEVLRDAEVQSEGQILASGISSVSESEATVLVAASAVVKNAEAVEGQTRRYRFKVTMVRQDDRWLVSEVEFVP